MSYVSAPRRTTSFVTAGMGKVRRRCEGRCEAQIQFSLLNAPDKLTASVFVRVRVRRREQQEEKTKEKREIGESKRKG